jgi:hypothetical protein
MVFITRVPFKEHTQLNLYFGVTLYVETRLTANILNHYCLFSHKLQKVLVGISYAHTNID